MNNCKTIVVFGAGSGCKKYLSENKLDENRVIIVDNNKELHGLSVEGIIVKGLDKINTEMVDKVIITVSDIQNVERQLKGVGIDNSKYEYPAKTELAEQCFEDKTRRDEIKNKLIKWINGVDDQGIRLLLEFGTALGIYRDGELIPWDNDIDLSIKKEDVTKLLEKIKRKNIRHTSIKSTVSKDGLQLTCEVEGIKCPINIDVREEVKNQSISSGGIIAKMKKDIIYPERRIDTKQGKYYMPNNTRKYLEEIYGESWRQPRKNFSFKDYEKNNMETGK